MQDSVAVVTGAATGNGRAIAEAFRREGARLVVADVDAPGLEAAWLDCPDVIRVQADVSRSEDCKRMVDTARAVFGRVDVLVNNAGITGSRQATVAHLTPLEEWERVLAVNLTGVFLGCYHVLPIMMEQGRGKIINIASVAGLVAFPGRCAYTASKGGVIQLTRSLAVDYAPYHINVNAICPGMIETNMTRWRLEQPELRREVLDRIPWGRIGTPQDVAEAAVFLASRDADYITGHALVVDGGWSSV